MASTETPDRTAGLTLRRWVRKIVTLVIVGLLLGWIYARVSPRMFPREPQPGFGYGMLHGGMMPMALPSLLMGQNVEIFAANNSGRSYMLGYICGINICGLIFFGSAFWSPKKKASEKNSPG